MGNDGEISAFNEGALQMQRIDELQQRLNLLNVDPLNFNLFTNQYNYETIFKTLNSLLSECSSKLSDKEKEEALRIKKIIDGILKHTQIFVYEYDYSFGGRRKSKTIDYAIWSDIQELLFFYELRIRHYLEEHNLTSPKIDSDGEWD